MAKTPSTNNPSSIMEKLLASSAKVINLRRGQEIDGQIIDITDSEFILDVGAKSEGVIPKKEFPASEVESLKVGSRLKAFVILPENENGQTYLSLHQAQPRGRRGREINWSRFKNAKDANSQLKGLVLEINKGGLIVEVMGIRGFLPNSLCGFEILSRNVVKSQGLIGQQITFLVSEVDENANKLIFTQKDLTEDSIKENLKNFKKGDRFKGKIASILPFGLVVEKEETRGLVLISEVSWERVEDLSNFKVGQEIEALVLGVDEDFGRLNLSIKQLTEDPFAKLAEKFPADEVVKGEVTEVSNAGCAVALDGAGGFLPASKMTTDVSYEVGKKMSFLVDGVDIQRRRINLAPFITTTEGLIYK